MSYFNPSSEYRRCGFNALTHFFFGKQQTEVGWPGPGRSVIKAIDIVMFTAQFIERMITPDKALVSGVVKQDALRTGLQYETMLIIIKTFAAYESRYEDGGKWDEHKLKGIDNCAHNISQGNDRYTVLSTINRDLSQKIKSDIVFSLNNDHWMINFNKPYMPTSDNFSLRAEFFLNLFVMCVESIRVYSASNMFTLVSVCRELTRYTNNRAGTPSDVDAINYVWHLYIWMLRIRKTWYINVSEVTQFFLGYSILRNSVNLNIAKGTSSCIVGRYLSFMDKDFETISAGSPNTRVLFDAKIGEITNGFTNFYSNTPVHNALFCKDITKFTHEDFSVEMYKRVVGMKTLLEKSGVLKISDKYKGSVYKNAWFANWEETIATSGSVDQKDPEKYLIGFNNLDTDSFASLGLGITSTVGPCNGYGSLTHLKFITGVVLCVLHNGGYKVPSDNPITMKDVKFIEFYNEICKMKKLELVDGAFGRVNFNAIFETLCVFGLFEFADLVSDYIPLKSTVKVSFKRISNVKDYNRTYSTSSVYSLLRDIVRNEMTIEL